jgi:PST family polysaccharide transporter
VPADRLAARKIRTDLALAAVTEVVQRLSTYVVLAVLARHYDKAMIGDLFAVVAVASLTATATEFGTSRYLVREIARSPQDALDHLGAVLALRIPLVAAALVGLGLGAAILRPGLLPTMALAGGAVLASDLYYSFGAFFLGLRHVKLRLVTALVGPALLIPLVLGVAAVGAPFLAVLASWAAAQGAALAAAYLTVRRQFGPLPRQADATRAARGAIAFFALGLLAVAHFKADTLLLYVLSSPVAVAVYESAYKLLELSRFALRPATMVFYPLAAASASEGRWDDFARLLRRGGAWAVGLGLGAALAMALLAPAVIRLVWGRNYLDAVPVVRSLFCAVPAVYLGIVATFAVGALGLEGKAARIVAGCLAANVGLNLVVIPRWGVVGAAWVTVATEAAGAAGMLALTVLHLRAVRAADGLGARRAG